MKTLLLLPAVLCVLSIHAQQADSIYTDTLNPDLSFQLDKRKWTLGLEFEGAYTYRRVNSPQHQELADCRAHHERNATGINFGITARRELTRNVELVSGLSFFQTGFEFSEEKKLSDTLNMEFMISCENGFIGDPAMGFVGMGFWDPRYVYVVYGLHPDTATLNIKLEYNYLEVPLMLKYNFGKHQTRGFIAGGVGLNYMTGLKQSITLTNDQGYSDHYVSTEIPDFYRRVNYSALGSIGLETKVNKHLSAGLHASGRYLLSSIFAGYKNYKENHFSISIGAGIYYHFAESKS